MPEPRTFGAVLKAAALPFAASLGVVYGANAIGAPERYALDLVHGAFVLSYLAAAVKVFSGTAEGAARFGFAIPRPKFPPKAAWVQLALHLGILAVLAAGLIYSFEVIGDIALDRGLWWLKTPTHIIPEFILTTLIAQAFAGALRARSTQAGQVPSRPLVEVKTCGLNTDESVDAAIEAGANMLGFVFFPPSPRVVTPFEALELMKRVPQGVLKVALFVDPDDIDVGSVARQLPIDVIQLHGLETPERVAQIRKLTNKPVIKAVAIADAQDVARAHAYEDVADILLLDAKAPADSPLPGGNALSFDWELIRGETWARPWMLAGGLTAENVAQAIEISGAKAVDVSSGIESEPGVKSLEKIREFLAAVRRT